jgi:4-amino-4-deoxy-L-arabinose transferase-like glycosyltransferase
VFRRRLYGDVRLRCLAAVCAFGLLFFSASTNKLPGYVLPLLPPMTVLMAAGFSAARRRAVAVAFCGALIALFPIAADVLPAAVARGLSRAAAPSLHWTWLAALPFAAAAALLEMRGQHNRAVWTLAAGVTAGVVLLKLNAYPVLDAQVSARGLWRRIEPCAERICAGDLHRAIRYGLNYYSPVPVPPCPAPHRPLTLSGEPMPLVDRDICRSALTILRPAL